MRKKPLLILLITNLILTACSGLKLQDYQSENCAKMPGEKTVTIIREKCFLCHKGDFATKELICSRKTIITDAVTSGRMPKLKKLNKEQLDIFLKWEQ